MLICNVQIAVQVAVKLCATHAQDKFPEPDLENVQRNVQVAAQAAVGLQIYHTCLRLMEVLNAQRGAGRRHLSAMGDEVLRCLWCAACVLGGSLLSACLYYATLAMILLFRVESRIVLLLFPYVRRTQMLKISSKNKDGRVRFLCVIIANNRHNIISYYYYLYLLYY